MDKILVIKNNVSYQRPLKVDVSNSVTTIKILDTDNSWITVQGGGGISELPIASSNSLGGIKIGANLSIDSTGKLSAVDTVYTLPKATTSSLGGIKVGTNLSIDSLGKLSCPNSTQVTIGDNGNWFFNGVDSHHKATGQGSNVVFSPTPPSDIYDGMIWVQAPTGTSTQYYNIDPIDVRLSSTLPATPSNGTIWIKK